MFWGHCQLTGQTFNGPYFYLQFSAQAQQKLPIFEKNDIHCNEERKMHNA